MNENTALADGDELLHRQAHPNFVQDGVPSSTVFRPTNKDEGKLSLDRDSLATAQQAHARHVASGFASIAVWSLAAQEYAAARTTAYAEAIPENPAHCYADFSAMTKGEQERASKLLKSKAVKVGKCYSPG
jgi:hypothetical protein